MRSKASLTIEITLILAIKLTLIYFVWALCFSHPIDKTLKPSNISSHLFQSSQRN